MTDALQSGASGPARINEPLVLDLLEWLTLRPRPYGEVMEAWKSSCPRLTVWEDSLDAGYVRRGADGVISVTAPGRDRLKAAGRL